MTAHRREFRRIGVVVAALNYFDDELFDWAAYSGDHLILDTTPDIPFEKYRL